MKSRTTAGEARISALTLSSSISPPPIVPSASEVTLGPPANGGRCAGTKTVYRLLRVRASSAVSAVSTVPAIISSSTSASLVCRM